MEKVIAEGLARLPSFSHAVEAGDFVYVSGTLGTVGDTMDLVEGGTGPETTQAIKNISRILSASGLDLRHVVKANVPPRHRFFPGDERGIHRRIR
jgi:2-iminobutanoate/2-iminopropanoate deaminase